MIRALLLFTLAAPLQQAAAQPAPVVTVEEQIASLHEVIREVESGRQMVLAPEGALQGWGAMVIVPRERVGNIAGWLVVTGRLHPDSAAGWAREQRRISAGALTAMKRMLEDLEARRDGPTPPPNAPAADPPTPPPAAVSANGTWSVSCAWKDPDFAPSRDGGRFTITIAADGAVAGTYESSSSAYPVGGRVEADGQARGEGTGAGWSIGWTGSIQRPAAGSVTGTGGIEVSITDFGGGTCSGGWSIP